MASAVQHHRSGRPDRAANLIVGGAAGRAGDSLNPSPAGKVPTAVQVAAGGRALIPIVIAPQADARTERLADDLAVGLRRITGAKFEIRHGEKPGGITLGTDRDWKGVIPPPKPGLGPLLTREDYVLQTGPEALLIVGREAIGLQNAVWDFFHRVGFRQFFPGPAWENWPREQNLSVALDVIESPDFYHRGFAFTGQANLTSLKHLGVIGGVTDLQAHEQYRRDVEQWLVRNRLVSGFDLRAAHAYGAIVSRNPAHFAANPKHPAAGTRTNGQARPEPADRSGHRRPGRPSAVRGGPDPRLRVRRAE